MNSYVLVGLAFIRCVYDGWMDEWYIVNGSASAYDACSDMFATVLYLCHRQKLVNAMYSFEYVHLANETDRIDMRILHERHLRYLLAKLYSNWQLQLTDGLIYWIHSMKFNFLCNICMVSQSIARFISDHKIRFICLYWADTLQRVALAQTHKHLCTRAYIFVYSAVSFQAMVNNMRGCIHRISCSYRISYVFIQVRRRCGYTAVRQCRRCKMLLT